MITGQKFTLPTPSGGFKGMNMRFLPFFVWFGVGFLGQYLTLQLQLRGLASSAATNLAFFIFMLGGGAALFVDFDSPHESFADSAGNRAWPATDSSSRN